MDVMLILQGGGSLGAYECGVYRALAPWIKEKGHRLSVVAGTSIGAVNASVIASRYGDADHGVAALTGLWQSLSEASALFLPPLGSLAGVNAVWTSLLFGNPRMFQPIVPLWTLMPPVTWAPFILTYRASPAVDHPNRWAACVIAPPARIAAATSAVSASCWSVAPAFRASWV
jgi:NTE family protein